MSQIFPLSALPSTQYLDASHIHYYIQEISLSYLICATWQPPRLMHGYLAIISLILSVDTPHLICRSGILPILVATQGMTTNG